MQNKGLVKLFALLFGLVSIYQLSFTFKANQIENNAAQYAISKVSESQIDFDKQRTAIEAKYLDSLTKVTVFDLWFEKYNFDQVKNRSMNLGLDLKGGISVILQISVKDILKSLSNNSTDPIFNQALIDAEEKQKNSQDTYIEDFFVAFDAIKGDTKLSSTDIFANRDLREEITFDMSDEDVQTIILKKIDQSIVAAFEVLRKRVDKFGITQPNIQRLGNSGRILVELPGAKDIDRVKKLLQSTAQLEFWYTLRGEDFINFIVQANEEVKAMEDTQKVSTTSDSTNNEIDDLLGTASESTFVEPNPISFVDYGYAGGPIVGIFDAKDQQRISDYLKMPEVRSLLSSEQRVAKFVWGVPALEIEKDENGMKVKDPETGLFKPKYGFITVELYALQGNRANKPELSGSVVVDASMQMNMRNEPAVSMQMNVEGSKTWEKMTGVAYTNGRKGANRSQIAIVLDETVYSAPGVTTGPISGGSSEITGSFTVAEAKDLANVLMAGKLPASADIIQADEVGPTLGKEAIDSGSRSFIIALLLVLAWMIFYYGKAGIFSNIALTLNILFIFGVLAGLGAVLTLPGIAGIVLTIGIAVDANVLIYERIREELLKGKKQAAAIQDGFSNALSSILDANITTGLTALILFSLGTGPIKGFATTLLIGILTSLFTAIFITRILIEWNMNRGGSLDFSTRLTKGLFRNISVNFLKKTKITYLISGSIIITGLASLFTTGLDQGIDFVGGRTYTVRFAQDVSTEEVKLETNAIFGSSVVKTIGSANQLKISTKYKVDENSAEVDEEIQNKLFKSLVNFLPKGYTYTQFLNAENNVGKMLSGKVSPTIADDIKQSSLWAVLASLVVVFLYILLRFKKWQFSLGAVAAVFHDVLIVLGIFSLTYKYMPFNMEIDQAFIAAILTVIGYSLNDTVVVFDRIREFIDEHSTWEFDKIVNTALNSTLSRTLNTSFTTLVVLISMFFLGADSLRGLLFALIIGVLVGTYSSVFIATPIMRDTLGKSGK